MEFVGYTVGELVGVANIIRAYDDNYVINDDGHTKLAIRLPSNNNALFALYIWDEYEGENVEAMRIVVQRKAEETIRFFQETTALINDHIPRFVYNDVMNIVKLNNGTIGRFQNNPNTDIRERQNSNSLEYDVRRHIWLVNVGRIVTFSLGNENSARQVYQLITRDILNYISFRWGRPQQ